MRVCKALDEPPRMLANNIGVPYGDIEPLLSPTTYLLADMDKDETWWLIYEYVGKRMGELMAARNEMDKKLQRDRSRRAVRHAAARKHRRVQ